ncbi:protein of unknown function (DU1801) [Lishizhenia tianjinensis]|uniref:YdhG-like domain-containing protein n=1 Tax=Lishizhenia tianjinensis TaxID=477690 RepID=A0A1I7ADM1_9FLAO|nr:DUF1801 domain-containing protein [Lishizhenia tianjinensis]SFT72988.1 protein of unknown function (DU1801) [Lishizhenia tianjinensis]
MEEISHIYLKQDEPLQSCWLALRTIIRKQDSLITECVKYGSPCFLYRDKILCYLWKDKKSNQPYILFSDGNSLHHPALDFKGRKKMKSMEIDPLQDIPIALVKEVLDEAIKVKNEKLSK